MRLLLLLGIIATAVPAAADPVRVRYREGPAHGFVRVSDLSGRTIAHGEMTQWLEKGAVANRLTIWFDDGSSYDERIRFAQDRVFRLLSYKLAQKGPSFTESSEIEFDRSGRYRVRLTEKPGAEEQHASGTTRIPDDVTNGITSLLLKNLQPGRSAKTHLMAFTPKPRALELQLTPEGDDPFWVGPTERRATRYLIEPRVTGVTGVVATAVGKQPPAFRMWIAQGSAPVLVRFEGPLYADGPVWRVELSAPRWER